LDRDRAFQSLFSETSIFLFTVLSMYTGGDQ
jgi:hypothetical protein